MKILVTIVILMVLIPMIFAFGNDKDFSINLDDITEESFSEAPTRPQLDDNVFNFPEDASFWEKLSNFFKSIIDILKYIWSWIVYIIKYLIYVFDNFKKIFKFGD